MSEEIQIENIRLDGGTQPRARLDPELVSEYAEAMDKGDKFPPVTVFFDGTDYWLADGFHRVHAADQARILVVDANIRQGTRRDAILFSASANSSHGLRRSNEDERRAVMTLLDDQEWSKWSDGEIARRCAVSQRFVSGLRASHTQNGSECTSRTFIHPKTGQPSTMQTANIGSGKSQPFDAGRVLTSTRFEREIEEEEERERESFAQ